MAYPRPMYKRPAPARKYRTKSVYKKTVKSSRQALPILEQKVQRIVRSMAGLKSTIQYKDAQGNGDAVGNIGGTNVYIKPLSVFANWERIFGADADDESNKSAIWKKTTLDFEINSNGERNSIDYSMYIVSLTKIGQAQLFTPASGGLAGPLGITSLTNNTHFYQANGGMALLNRKYFNIHYVRRPMTGSTQSTTTEATDLRKRYYIKLSHNGGKGHIIKNPNGDWKATPSPQAAAQNLYVLLFNNDSTADNAVRIYHSTIHTVDVV